MVISRRTPPARPAAFQALDRGGQPLLTAPRIFVKNRRKWACMRAKTPLNPRHDPYRGEVAEWSNAAVSKTVVGLRRPRVRIPVSPPYLLPLSSLIGLFKRCFSFADTDLPKRSFALDFFRLHLLDLHRFRPGLLRAIRAIKETGYCSDTQRRVQARCGWHCADQWPDHASGCV